MKMMLSRKEAAHALSVSVRLLDSLISRRELRTRRIGRRVLIEHRELERFARADHILSGRTHPPTPQETIVIALQMPQDALQVTSEA